MFDVAAHIHILNKISSKMLGTGQHLLKMLDRTAAMISDALTAQRFAALQQRAGQTVV